MFFSHFSLGIFNNIMSHLTQLTLTRNKLFQLKKTKQEKKKKTHALLDLKKNCDEIFLYMKTAFSIYN